MRCNICDGNIDRPVWNSKLNNWEVCPPCLEIINRVFENPVTQDVYEDSEEILDEENT